MKKEKNNALSDHLHRMGILGNGSPEQIQKEKNAYWKEYRRQYSQKKRKEEKSYTISFTQKEHLSIKKAAKHLTCTEFIRDSALSKANSKDNRITQEQYNSIIELLSLSYTIIQSQEDEERITPAHSLPILNLLQSVEDLLKEKMK